MPRALPEAAADEESPDSNGNSESDKGSDGSDTEDSTDSDFACEDEQSEEDANDSVEPDCVDRRLCGFIDLLPDVGKGEAVISCVGVCNSGCGDHAALTHTESADNGDGKTGECDVLG